MPETTDRVVPGVLTFDEDGVTLVIYGNIHPPGTEIDIPEWRETPVILGRSHEGDKVSVLHAEGANFTHERTAQSVYKVGLALRGVHVDRDMFTEAWCEFDCLEAWVGSPSLVDNVLASEQVAVRIDDVEIDHAEIESASVSLIAGTSYELRPHEVRVTQEPAFHIRIPKSSLHNLLDAWVRPLQDLVTFSLDRSVRLTTFRLKPAGLSDADRTTRLLGVSDRFADAFFPAVQARPGRVPTREEIETYTAPTLLTYRTRELPFQELVSNWFALRTEIRDVFVLLTAPYNARFMFDEHRYSSAFQSAELLAKKRIEAKDKTPEEHSARVEAIISTLREANVNSEDVEWAERVLRSRNDKPLRELIAELTRSIGAVGQAIFEASPNFSAIATNARTGVSHPGLQRRLGADGRYWYADALRWIVRARLLMDMGISLDTVERRVLGRGSFSQMLEEIARVSRRHL